MTMTDTPADNGVNVEALLGARQHLSEMPEAAKFEWRATTEWVRGTHCTSSISTFSGLGQEHAHRQTFTIDADHPEIFASEDNGPTAPEIVLSALGACLMAGVASVATNRGVQLRSVKATVTGSMDLQGILGIDGDVRNGFDGVRVMFDIDADADREDLEAIIAQSQKRSATFDIMANPTPITVGLA